MCGMVASCTDSLALGDAQMMHDEHGDRSFADKNEWMFFFHFRSQSLHFETDILQIYISFVFNGRRSLYNNRTNTGAARRNDGRSGGRSSATGGGGWRGAADRLMTCMPLDALIAACLWHGADFPGRIRR